MWLAAELNLKLIDDVNSPIYCLTLAVWVHFEALVQWTRLVPP